MSVKNIIQAAAIALVFCLISSYTFAQSFRFAFLSDTHIGLKNAEEDLRSAVADINADTTLKFVIISGDITDLSTRDELLAAKAILSRLNKPLYISSGNHDGNWSPTGGKEFRELIGSGRFAFTYQGYLFIGTNSGPNMLHKSAGEVPREDIVWLDSIINRPGNQHLPIIYVNHYPQDQSQLNWYEALDRLKQKNIQLLLVGHGHKNGKYVFEGIPAIMGRTTMRDSSGSGGYNIVSISAAKATFTEKKPLKHGSRLWAEVALVDHHYQNDPTKYPRPSYAINKENANVRVGWTYQADYDLGAGIVSYHRLIIAADNSGEIFALDKGTGKKQWRYSTEGKIYSMPALSGNRLIVASTNGFIYCLNPVNGQLLWQTNTGYPIVAQPLINKGRLYMGSSNGVFRALDISNGNTLWTFSGVKDFVQTRPLIYQDRLYFGSWGNEFYALNAQTGALIWKWSDALAGRINAPAGCVPVATHNQVFIVSPDQLLTVFNAANGNIISRQKIPAIKARESIGLSADSMQLYIKGIDGKVFSLASANLQIQWETNLQVGYDLCAAPLSEKNSIIYAASNSGVASALNTENGSIRWQYKVSNALINNIVPDEHGKIVFINTADGKITSLKIN